MEIQNVKMWTDGVPVEHAALQQIRNISQLPILAGHMAVMPDVHLGKGATVGSVIPTIGAVIPASVGVDIGCGVCATKTTLKATDLPDSLFELRSKIEAVVPVGFNYHDKQKSLKSGGLMGMALDRRMKTLDERFEKIQILKRYKNFDYRRAWNQIGTLGGGKMIASFSW